MRVYRREGLTLEPKLLEIVRMLVAADQKEGDFDASGLLRLTRRKGCPTIIPYSHSNAQDLAELLSEAELRHLIRALVKFSVVAGPSRSGGSASPVSPLYREYAARYPDLEPELTSWVVENRVTRYDPFGTVVFADATSLEQHNRWRRERQEEGTRNEERRVAAARSQQATKATERLPNAVRRGDVKAVEAMLEKGAEPKVASLEVGHLQDLARQHGRDAMLDYLKSKGIE